MLASASPGGNSIRDIADKRGKWRTAFYSYWGRREALLPSVSTVVSIGLEWWVSFVSLCNSALSPFVSWIVDLSAFLLLGQFPTASCFLA